MSSRNAPQVRRVNMLSEFRDPDSGQGTEAFFRAVSEADGYIRDIEHAAELACRCDELTALIDQIKELHAESPGSHWNWCANCGVRWPCPTMALIEGK